jgi:hypothetical protein
MSETDRIAVPTNGHKPHAVAAVVEPDAPATPPAAADDAADAASKTTAAGAGGAGRADPAAKATSPELTIAVTPAQLAVGFGVIAGIILLLVGRRRGRRRS